MEAERRSGGVARWRNGGVAEFLASYTICTEYILSAKMLMYFLLYIQKGEKYSVVEG